MNPCNIHLKLQKYLNLKSHFFSSFGHVSCHSLPDVDYCLDPVFEPCMQHPPIVPDDYMYKDITKEWSDDFVYEIKSCGEILQKHVCRNVTNMVMKVIVILCFCMK